MSPWSRKQVETARAVAHGFRPTGKAKSFTGSLAQLILAEGKKNGKKAKR